MNFKHTDQAFVHQVHFSCHRIFWFPRMNTYSFWKHTHKNTYFPKPPCSPEKQEVVCAIPKTKEIFLEGRKVTHRIWQIILQPLIPFKVIPQLNNSCIFYLFWHVKVSILQLHENNLKIVVFRHTKLHGQHDLKVSCP